MSEPEIAAEFALDYKRLKALRRYRFAPRNVLDVGASSGVWSATCALVFPGAKYFLIEPQSYEQEHPWPEGVQREWIREAVGKEEKAIEMVVPEGEDSVFRAHILPTHRHTDGNSRSISVKQTTVDQLLEKGVIAPPELVKLDVQGYELEVLEGATKIWESAKIFFVEVSIYEYWNNAPQLAEVVAFFAKRGFQVYDVSTECRERPSDLLSQIDLLFVDEACQMSRVMGRQQSGVVSWPIWG